MKWQLNRSEPVALWEEDGDLQRMKTFFQTIESESEGNEQIKQSVKKKALEKMARAEEEEVLPVKNQEGFVQRTRVGLRTLIGNFRWKLSLSVAMVAILVIIGQGAMGTSWGLFPSTGSEKPTHSTNISEDMSASASAMEEGIFKGKGEALYGDMSGRNGSEQKVDSFSTADTDYKQEQLALLPIPPDQEVAPPDDAGIARKIIHDLSLTLEVTIINDAVTLISEEVQKHQGYVVSSQQSGSDKHSFAHITVKIPADKLTLLRDSLSSWGKVLDQRLFANDITNQYYDSQSRLLVREAEEKRYLEILNQAKTVEDVLKVENALGNVRQEIESLKGQLKLWNNQVDYSTVTIQLVTQKSPDLKVENPWQPISWSKTWNAAGDAVLKTLSSTWNALNYLIVGIGYASPFILIGALGWGVYRIWKKRNSE